METLSYCQLMQRCGELEAQVKQLAAERDAVVAENAALKSAHPQPFGPEMMRALEAYEWHQDDVPETGMLNAFFILRDSITLNNGVTDSVVAKIRAESMADGAFGALKLMGGFTSDECGDSVYLTVKGYAEQLSNSVYNPGAFLASLRAEGVEMFAQYLKDKYEGIEYSLIGEYYTNGEEDRISDQGEIDCARDFAAQLRSQSALSPRVAATPETAAIARMFEQVKGVQS